MPAAFEGSSFLLTYPQSDFNINEYLQHFSSLPSVSYVCVSSEQHADGSLHRHALVYFNKRQRLNATFFDYKERHPNVKAVGKKKSDWENVLTYVQKDGAFLVTGIPRHTKDTWANVATASSREEALALIQKEKPRDFIINRRNIDYALDSLFPVQTTTQFTPRSSSEFILPDPVFDGYWRCDEWRHGGAEWG